MIISKAFDLDLSAVHACLICTTYFIVLHLNVQQCMFVLLLEWDLHDLCIVKGYLTYFDASCENVFDDVISISLLWNNLKAIPISFVIYTVWYDKNSLISVCTTFNCQYDNIILIIDLL